MEVTAVGQGRHKSVPDAIGFAYNQSVSGIVVNGSMDANGLTLQAAGAGYPDISWRRPNVNDKS